MDKDTLRKRFSVDYDTTPYVDAEDHHDCLWFDLNPHAPGLRYDLEREHVEGRMKANGDTLCSKPQLDDLIAWATFNEKLCRSYYIETYLRDGGAAPTYESIVRCS